MIQPWSDVKTVYSTAAQFRERIMGYSAEDNTGLRTKCHTIECTHTHLTSGTELILIGWKIVHNESL